MGSQLKVSKHQGSNMESFVIKIKQLFSLKSEELNGPCMCKPSSILKLPETYSILVQYESSYTQLRVKLYFIRKLYVIIIN